MHSHSGPAVPVIQRSTVSRRSFVEGLVLGGIGSGLWRGSAWGAGPVEGPGVQPQVLGGTEFDLAIGEMPVNFTGRARRATVVNGSLPAPLLRWREGDTVRLRVTNHLAEPTSIHWHGIILPAAMDGVPGLSFEGIDPGETFEYRFRVRQSGTYWYHSHSGFQEQTGLYGPLVILPRDAGDIGAERDYVVMLSDWTDEDPHRVLAKLKKQSDYYNFHQRTVGDFLRDARRDGLRAALAERGAWGAMRMNPTDLADVTGATYTYLMNGTTPAGNWTGLFRRGERVRLRFINAAAMTYFDVRIPGLSFTVVAADGQPVHPVTVEEFRIAPAETYDVIVTPQGEEPYTIFAQSAGPQRLRAGHARAASRPERPGARARSARAADHGRHGAHGPRGTPDGARRGAAGRPQARTGGVRPRRGHARRHAEPASRRPGCGPARQRPAGADLRRPREPVPGSRRPRAGTHA